MNFGGLNFDPYVELDQQFHLEGYNSANARLTIGGQNFPIHSVQVIQQSNQGANEAGLSITLAGIDTYLHLILWGGPDNDGNYSLNRIAIEEAPLICQCIEPKEEVGGLSAFSINDQGDQILLNIPFLNNLKLEMTGNPSSQLIAPWIARAGIDQSALENWIELSSSDFDKLLATPLEGNDTWGLPYDLTPHIPDIIGIEDYPFPASSRLVLTGLEVGTERAEADLLLLTEAGGTLLPFLATGISIGSHSLGLKDLQLFLPEERGSLITGLPITYHAGSVASFSCNGFSTFKVEATYQVDSNHLITPNIHTQTPLNLNFTIRGQEVDQFVAPIQVSGDTTAFVIKGGEGQVFHLKNGYIDLSSVENVPGMSTVLPPSFNGLFFKEMEMEVQGFRENGDIGDPLLVPARNFFFRPGKGLGLEGEILLDGFIDEEKALELGDWVLTMDRIQYRVANNTVKQRQIDGRLRLPRSPDRPWISYQFQLGYDLAIQAPQVQMTIEDPALQAYLVNEGISNYAFDVLLSEDKVFQLMLKVDDQPATFDYCLQFESGQSFVQIEGANVVYPSYTKEAWVYLEPGPGNNSIMAGKSTCLAISESNDYRLSAGHNGEWSIVEDSLPLLPGTWYHIAVTYEAASKELRLYRDGELVGFTTAPLHNETEQYIGGLAGLPDFNGRINEVRIWKTVRSAAEIQANRNLEIDPGDPNLVVYYRMDEGPGNEILEDRTGHGHSGKMINMNPNTSWSGTIAQNMTGVSGLYPVMDPENLLAIQGANYAIQLDGYDDRINLGRRINLYDQSFTIECWARQTTATGKAQYLAGQGFEAENRGLNIGFRADRRFEFSFYKNALVSNKAETGSDWHHWACVYDADATPGQPNRFLYRDGELIASDHSSSPFQGRGEFYIGTGLQPGLYFNGAIDEFRIWQLARSPEEIRQGIKGPLYGFESGLLAHYPLNEGSGIRLIQDQSGRGNVGALEQIDLLGSWIIASLPVLYFEEEEETELETALNELKDDAAKAKEKALEAKAKEEEVEEAFSSLFNEIIDFAIHRADSAIQLADILLDSRTDSDDESVPLREGFEQIVKIAAIANLAAQDALDLATDVRFYPDQPTDYVASWDGQELLSIRYRNEEAYQQVKYLMTTEDSNGPLHWNHYHKSNYAISLAITFLLTFILY